VWLGVDELPLPTALLIAVLTYGAAILSKRYVEEPFHHSPVLRRRPERALRLGAVCVGAGVIAGFVLWVPGAIAERFAPDPSLAPGAEAVLGEPSKVDPTAGAAVPQPSASATPAGPAFVPALAAVRDDAPAVNADGCNQRYTGVDVPECVYGQADAPRTMVLIGDSHAATWFPPLEAIATEQGWRLVSITKHGCTVADTTVYNGAIKRAYTECDQFRANAFKRIADERPDLVITANRQDYRVMDGDTRLGRSASAKALQAGLVRSYSELDRIAGEVLVLQDNPIPGVNRLSCLSDNEDDPTVCDQPLSEMLAVPKPERAAAREAGVLWNPTSWMFCPQKVCSTVIGGVVVWRDDDHATATYTRTLAPYLQRIIDRATQS